MRQTRRFSTCTAMALAAGLATAAWAQYRDPAPEEERQPLSVSEPERRARALAPVQRLVALRYSEAREGFDMFGTALPQLAAYLAREVDLGETRFLAEEIALTEPPLDGALVVFLSGNQSVIDLPQDKKARLGRYLKAGGLLFADDVRPAQGGFRSSGVAVPGTPFDRQLKALVTDTLLFGSAGQHWQTVPRNHELYRAYYAFADGPPLNSAGAGSRQSQPVVTELEMLEYRGRVAVLFSDLNISYGWAYPSAVGRQRALQFGANLVVFALAQRAGGGLLTPSARPSGSGGGT